MTIKINTDEDDQPLTPESLYEEYEETVDEHADRDDAFGAACRVLQRMGGGDRE